MPPLFQVATRTCGQCQQQMLTPLEISQQPVAILLFVWLDRKLSARILCFPYHKHAACGTVNPRNIIYKSLRPMENLQCFSPPTPKLKIHSSVLLALRMSGVGIGWRLAFILHCFLPQQITPRMEQALQGPIFSEIFEMCWSFLETPTLNIRTL